MDYTKYLREDQWEQIKDSLPGKAGDVGRTGDHRRFIEAVMWMGRTGAPWRAWPRVYGPWSGVHQRVPTVGESRCLANDFQYLGGRCRHGMADD